MCRVSGYAHMAVAVAAMDDDRHAFRMTWRRIASAIAVGTLAGCTQAPPAKPAEDKEVRPVFCYRTLADVGCYTEVDPGRERRLTGIYMFVGEPWWVTYSADTSAPETEEEVADAPLPLFPVSP